jgi:serine/threonine protein kinase
MIEVRTPGGLRLRIGDLLATPTATSAVHRGELSNFGDVAVKVLNKSGGYERRSWEAWKFRRETRCAHRLRHVTAVRQVLDSFELSGSLARRLQAPLGCWIIVYEFVGESLRDVLSRRRGTLPPEDIRDLADTLADGLSVVHNKGIVHRDLKPENILVVGGSLARARICDFGVALCSASRKSGHAATRVGTPGYIAPELKRDARSATRSADVFSLAALLWECFFGVPPTVVARGASQAGKVRRVSLPLAPGIDRRLPNVSSVLRKGLSTAASARPKSATVLVRRFVRAGALDGLWPSPFPVRTPTSRQRQSRGPVQWPYSDYRMVGGALWIYTSPRNRGRLEKASRRGVHWTYATVRQGFYTKSERVNPERLLQRVVR